MDIPENKRCTATSKQTKTRCKNWAIKGTNVCRFHGANKAVRAKAKQTVMAGKVRALMEKVGNVTEDPLEGLLEEVVRSAVAVRIFEGLLSDIEATDLYGPNHRKDSVAHILVRMHAEERERHARFCKMALDAGVQERQVQVAEAQGQMMARVIAAVFDDPTLGLTEAQRRMGKKTAARHLKALPAAG